MAWELEIHHIDVEQGESTLIVASNPTNNIYNTMLIDGGLQDKARRICKYAMDNAPDSKINRIVTTHWDEDHSYGMTALLTADNLDAFVDLLCAIADSANDQADLHDFNMPVWKRKLWIATEVGAACLGAYEKEHLVVRKDCAIDALGKFKNDPGLVALKNLAWAKAKEYSSFIDSEFEEAIIAATSVVKAIMNCVVTAGMPNDSFSMGKTAKGLYKLLGSKVGINASFQTDGMLNDVIALDIGDIEGGSGILSGYKKALVGKLTLSGNHVAVIPSLNRKRYAPKIGDELFWNDGKGNSNVPTGAPTVHVFAIRGEARNGTNKPKPFNGNMYNKVSFGMMVRFNQFVFYTGGDLPYQGEELIGTDVVAKGVKPWGNFEPTHVCCFKCGHHGSHESTSSTFTKAIKPVAAMISCGPDNDFDHPRQEVIDVLHGTKGFENCYMTACSFTRNHVPGFNDNQLTTNGNQFFVAGNDKVYGDILVTVNEKQSLSTAKPSATLKLGEEYHSFQVSYYDKDENSGNGGTRTASHKHKHDR